MEKKPLIQNEIDYYHNEAIRMIVKEEKLPSQVKRGLIQLGADEGVASEIANSAQDLVREAKNKKANKDQSTVPNEAWPKPATKVRGTA